MKAGLILTVLVILILAAMACLQAQTTVTLGSGTSYTGATEASPINIHYRSLRGQMVVTADELAAAGLSGFQILTSIGFNIHEAPLYALPDFSIRVSTAWNDDVSMHYTAPLKTVYRNPSYLPQAGGYQMLDLTDSYIWDGVSNLLIDVSFNLAQESHDSGSVQTSPFSNGFRYARSNDASQINAYTDTVVNYRPNIRLSFSPFTQVGWSGMSQPSPFGTSTNRYQGSASIYKPSQIGGFDLITHLGWEIRSINHYQIPIKIYMKTTSLNYFNSSTRNWYELKNGATEVFNGTVSFNRLGWIILDVQDFNYQEGNLMVMCETLFGSTITNSPPMFAFTYSNLIAPTDMQHQWFSGGSLYDDGPGYGLGTINNQLPNIVMAGIAANPRSFSANATSYDQIDLQWTQNLHETPVMILASLTESFPDPVNGESYQVGDILPDGASVVYIGSDLSCSHTGLEPDTQYFYQAHSVDVSHYSSGVHANARTHLAPYSGFPLIETFEDQIYPPFGWTTAGPSNFWQSSNSVGAFDLSSASIVANLMMWSPEDAGSIISPLLDLSGLDHPHVKFDYAHTAIYNEASRMEVFSSPDNGATYSLLCTMGGGIGETLDTGGPGLRFLLPTPQQWSTQIVPLPAGTNRVKITTTPGDGAELYLDNLSIEEGSAAPLIHVTPHNKHFGEIQTSLTSSIQSFSLRNVGSQPLNITGISFDSNDAGRFALTGLDSYPHLLAPGDEALFTAVFQPNATGAATAQIRISTDSAAVDDFVVHLYGTGIDTAVRELPYIQTWDVYDEEEDDLADGWTFFNVNRDGLAWTLWADMNEHRLQARLLSYQNQAQDDWIISRAIELTQGQSYTFTYDYKMESYMIQKMKLAIGRAQDPEAMFTVIADHPDIQNTVYQSGSASFTPSETGMYFLGFHCYTPAQPSFSGMLFLDNIRVLLPNSQIQQVTAINSALSVDFDPILVQGSLISPTIAIDGVIGYQPLNVAIADQAPWSHPNAGLSIKIDGADLSGATLTITHNLGFVPSNIAWKIGSGGLILLDNPGDWTDQQVQFTLGSFRADDSVKILFPKSESSTLPVQLSSFTAVLSSHEYVQIAWTVQSETSHQGYNILRAETPELSQAIILNPELITDGQVNGTQVSYLFRDQEIEPEHSYYYWLSSVATSGISTYFGPLEIYVTADPNDPSNPGIPLVTELLNAFPNPFNPSTTISYSLAAGADVSIDIYNSRGQKIRTFQRSHSNMGRFQVIWDGKDSRGNTCASGVYLYRMSSGSYSASQKMIILK